MKKFSRLICLGFIILGTLTCKAGSDWVEDLNNIAKGINELNKQITDTKNGKNKQQPSQQNFNNTNQDNTIDENRDTAPTTSRAKKTVPKATEERYRKMYSQQEERVAYEYSRIEYYYNEIKDWEMHHWREIDYIGRGEYESSVMSYLRERKKLGPLRREASHYGVKITSSLWETKKAPTLKQWWNRPQP